MWALLGGEANTSCGVAIEVARAWIQGVSFWVKGGAPASWWNASSLSSKWASFGATKLRPARKGKAVAQNALVHSLYNKALLLGVKLALCY